MRTVAIAEAAALAGGQRPVGRRERGAGVFVAALRVHVAHGADRSIRTEIDDRTTPLEEARNLGRLNASRFLERLV